MNDNKVIQFYTPHKVTLVPTVFLSTLLIRLERWRGRKANENEIKSVQSSGWDAD